MLNFKIQFTHPWLLLLLIPALFLSLYPYFRISKKYRRTRNRIVSLVLHVLVMLCSVSLISGVTLAYQENNEANEIILLVDMSDTENVSAETRDEFVQTVIKGCRYDGYRVGVVKFGFDQVYSVPLTDNVNKVYDKYKNSADPDVSATNIAAALNYAKNLFNHPESSKIVLITDGKETDENAFTAIRSVAAQGTRVDTALIPSSYQGYEAQIVEVTFPESYFDIGDDFNIGVKIRSNSATDCSITYKDRGVEKGTLNTKLNQGETLVNIPYIFDNYSTDYGLHEFTFELSVYDGNDTLSQNNNFTSYLYMEVFNKILIIDAEGETSASVQKIKSFLTEDDAYSVSVYSVDSDELPRTVDKLREYDQIILNNVSNSDLTSGETKDDLVDALYSYVYDYGGALFTVGGDRAFIQDDMVNTKYQQMLPVQAIEYTPPVGVVFVIDISGSMSTAGAGGKTPLQEAVEGAKAAKQVLTQRDYMGIITFGSDYETVLPMTSRTKESKIDAALDSIDKASGGTVLPGALRMAGQLLNQCRYVDKRHIIVVTDGQVPAAEADIYLSDIDTFYNNDGTTVSVIAIGDAYDDRMEAIVSHGHGNLYKMNAGDDTMSAAMRDDLLAPSIKDIEIPEGGFSPIVHNVNSPLFKGVIDFNREGGETGAFMLESKLDGFNGVKIRSSSDLILVGDYDVPIYAQWKFGKGSVGSFMSDLGGSWSTNFFDDGKDGEKFISNVIKNLMPKESIRANFVEYTLKEDNYTNVLSVYSKLTDDQKIVGSIVKVSEGERTDSEDNAISLNRTGSIFDPVYVQVPLDKDNNYTKCNIVVKESGVYKITLQVVSGDGNASTYPPVIFYKTFSYSEEYDAFNNESTEDVSVFLEDLANRGNGSLIKDIEDPTEIYKNFVTNLNRVIDPRMGLAIASILMLLVDIAVRKFKFKWLHEIIKKRSSKN